MRRLACVVGARPNFVKMAPILAALERAGVAATLVHTGQHYDPELSQVFFDELGITPPAALLDVGSGSHGAQTARVLERFEAWLLAQDAPITGVVVVGDVNSTLACALAAVKLRIPVAHVEAGLRSGDRGMPEEINRVATDAISDLLLASEPAGEANLRAEGLSPERVRLVGNVMIDTLRLMLPRARTAGTPESLGLVPGRYGVVTMHRPANVDDPSVLEPLLRALVDAAARLPLVLPLHPRTRASCERHGLLRLLDAPGLHVSGPLGYVAFLGLTSQARLVITDSGGLQEETTALEVPCLTLRPHTERPITVDEGTSTLVGRDADALRAGVAEVLDGSYKQGRCPALWDGHAADRVAEALAGLRWA